MDSPAIRKYRRLKDEMVHLRGAKLEKAFQDLKVLEDIIRTQNPGFTFEAPPEREPELAAAIKALQDRLDNADAWFANPANANHPQFGQFGHAAAQLGRELGDLTAKAYERGLYWDGQRLIPWADAFNPAAVASPGPGRNWTRTRARGSGSPTR